MRIAQVAPLFESVPPSLYGGTERVIAALCDGLAELGHDVTLFGAATSSTRAQLRPYSEAPLRATMSVDELRDVAPHLHFRMLADVFGSETEFDVVHAHTDTWTLPFATRSATPTVLTLHGRLDTPLVRRVLAMYPEVPLASISDHQRRAVADLDLRWLATAPNGLDLHPYLDAEPSRRGDHLAFVGRISVEKRLDLAIAVARRTGRQLRIAAKVDPFDLAYFETEIEPQFGDDTAFIGEIGERQKPAFFAAAAATLFPSDWPEPFGLVMIESLAAGTPVIALRRGSVPEILIDGVTGFICDDVDQMVDAVGRLDEIDADDCRRRALDFSAEAMCRRYVDVYSQLTGRAPDGPFDVLERAS